MSDKIKPNLVGLISKRWVGKYIRFAYVDPGINGSHYREGLITGVSSDTIKMIEDQTAAMRPQYLEGRFQLSYVKAIDRFSDNGRYVYTCRNEDEKIETRRVVMNRNVASDIRFRRRGIEKALGQKEVVCV